MVITKSSSAAIAQTKLQTLTKLSLNTSTTNTTPKSWLAIYAKIFSSIMAASRVMCALGPPTKIVKLGPNSLAQFATSLICQLFWTSKNMWDKCITPVKFVCKTFQTKPASINIVWPIPKSSCAWSVFWLMKTINSFENIYFTSMKKNIKYVKFVTRKLGLTSTISALNLKSPLVRFARLPLTISESTGSIWGLTQGLPLMYAQFVVARKVMYLSNYC